MTFILHNSGQWTGGGNFQKLFYIHLDVVSLCPGYVQPRPRLISSSAANDPSVSQSVFTITEKAPSNF